MILINLLPHREAARKRRREMFYAGLGASAVAGALIAGGIYLWYAALISEQQDRNMVLSSEIKKLDAQIKDIASLQEEIAALRARQQAVEDLQANRNMPVHLLNDMVRLLPDGVYLSSLAQAGDIVTLGGVAQSNERVSELLRNLAAGSSWITKPELIEIVAGTVTLPPKDTRRVYNYKMTIKLVRPTEVKPGASPAAPGAAGVALTPTAAASAAPATPAPVAAVAAAAPASAKK